MNNVLIILCSLVYFTLVGFELLGGWHPFVALIIFILVPLLVYWCLVRLIWARKHRKSSHRPASNLHQELSEAYEILGLLPTADQKDVIAAHRRLIRHNHPDNGGSTHLAKLINEAKTVLMKHFLETSS